MSTEKHKAGSPANQGVKSQNRDYSKVAEHHFSSEGKLEQSELAVLHSLRMAVRFAELAEDHRSLYDLKGFEHCAEEFLAHARKVSEELRNLKSLKKEVSKNGSP